MPRLFRPNIHRGIGCQMNSSSTNWTHSSKNRVSTFHLIKIAGGRFCAPQRPVPMWSSNLNHHHSMHRNYKLKRATLWRQSRHRAIFFTPPSRSQDGGLNLPWRKTIQRSEGALNRILWPTVTKWAQRWYSARYRSRYSRSSKNALKGRALRGFLPPSRNQFQEETSG